MSVKIVPCQLITAKLHSLSTKQEATVSMSKHLQSISLACLSPPTKKTIQFFSALVQLAVSTPKSPNKLPPIVLIHPSKTSSPRIPTKAHLSPNPSSSSLSRPDVLMNLILTVWPLCVNTSSFQPITSTA